MTKRFTVGELSAMLEATRTLVVHRAIHLEDYASTTEYHSLPVTALAKEGDIRNRLSELTQYLAQCPCFAQHGEQHTMSFLRRYAEIALKSYRKKTVT